MQSDSTVPMLRFNEFSKRWDLNTLSGVSTNISYGVGASAISFDGHYQYLRITDIDDGSRKFVPNPLCSPGGIIDLKYILKDGDIVFARTGASVGKTYLYNSEDGILIYAGYLIRFNIRNADPYFIFSITLRNQYFKWVAINSMRSGQPGINAEEYKQFSFYIPQMVEQQKIAAFLSAVDKKIQLLQKKKELLGQYKKGVMQKIFSREIRFKDENGQDYPEWEEKMLNYYLSESKTRNYDNRFSKQDVLSVSGDYGIVNQIEFQGRSFAGALVDNYHVVEPGDVVYTKSPLKANPYGIIKSNKGEAGIVSTLYAVYKPKEFLNSNFIDYYFQLDDNLNRYLRPLVHKGAKNDMKINNNRVLIDPVLFPSLPEQERIVQFIELIDEKLRFLSSKLNLLTRFKKGLLQQMFV